MKTFNGIILAASAALAVAAPASAATQSTTFLVTANVAGTCGITANPIAFGTVTGAVAQQSADVSVNCTTNTAYSISLNNGSNFSTNRRMSNGSGGFIPYQIHLLSYSGAVWNTTNVASDLGNGAGQAKTMYGETIAVTSPPSGNYTDTITATVTY